MFDFGSLANSLLAVEVIATFVCLFGAFYINLLISYFIRSRNRKGKLLSLDKWKIARGVNISFFLIWIIVIIVVHIIAFLTLFQSYYGNYTIFNWPYPYYQALSEGYSWPFLSLMSVDVVAAFICTIIVIILASTAYILSKLSKEASNTGTGKDKSAIATPSISNKQSEAKDRFRRISNTLLSITFIFDIVIALMWKYLYLTYEQRPIFVVSLFVVMCVLLVFIFVVWRPLYKYIVTTQVRWGLAKGEGSE